MKALILALLILAFPFAPGNAGPHCNRAGDCYVRYGPHFDYGPPPPTR